MRDMIFLGFIGMLIALVIFCMMQPIKCPAGYVGMVDRQGRRLCVAGEYAK